MKTRTELDPEEQTSVVALADRCAAADGSHPLNDAARFNLADRYDARHWLIEGEGGLLAYAQLAADNTVQLCVDPQHRQRGHASRVIRSVLTETGSRQLSWWSFGALPPAKALAEKLSLQAVRELLIMKRSLTDPIPAVDFPDGVTVSTFTPADSDAWLRVNARAFAQHQEQGAIKAEDLAARQREPWFDADGFFLAYRGADLLGYHWTKIHEEENPPVGEVYVLGVDPDAGRSGIGRGLLNRGLTYLSERGLDTVILYVEADQAHVVDLYSSAGFAVAHRDLLYTSSQEAATAPIEQGDS